MSSDLFQSAIQKVTTAIEFDNKKQYKEAFDYYQQALQMFIVVLKYEKNARAKEFLGQRVKQYMARAEELRAIVTEKNKHILATGNTNDTGVDEDETKKSKDKFEVTKLQDKYTWDDVAGLEKAKRSLQEAVILPMKFPQLFDKGRESWKGILLYGSPGTGKSFLAKVVASVSGSNFYSISSSDIVSKWLGESEKAIRDLFTLARENSPSVIFIDEVDSICGERSDNENDATRRIKTEILVQMEGVGKDNDKVLVLAATNTPWSLDPAFRRRFQKRIYIPLPDKKARKKIIHSFLKKCDNDVTPEELNMLADITDGYSGSDLSNLMRDALMEPIRRLQEAKQFIKVDGKWSACEKYPNCPQCPMDLTTQPPPQGATCESCGAVRIQLYDIEEQEDLTIPIVKAYDVEQALQNISKTVSEDDLRRYDKWTQQYGVNGVS